MTSATEAGFARTPLGADLAAGVSSISYDQSVTFTLYKRLVLPLDGYVFFVRADIIGNQSAIFNRGTIGGFQPNQFPTNEPAQTFIAKGSLHFSTEVRQTEDSTYVANRMVFTALEEISQLNAIAPETMWIASFPDGPNPPIKFAFSGRSIWYKQANLWHYTGYAVYADMATQIVDDPLTLNTRDVIVSDSLPIWLGLNGYLTAYGFSNPWLRLYPSFLTPKNLEPPYATVHIFPEGTQGLQMAPLLDRNRSHSQLCSDKVRVTLYGLRNNEALDFIDCVNDYITFTGLMGLMSIPVPKDEKRIQQELGAIAMKKTVDYTVSYNQSTVRDFAQKYILAAGITLDVPGIDPAIIRVSAL